ncbi:GtrA family protein [uncultured Ramlibacter sp.]|uniref:GtrA family protein n=1 Tax=uncultured Ramlibacter sp. TaxID=260755 RepID=UPI0026320EBF|nr:GtrA family protein [uncultured Ramlibacter sp.]
MKGLLRIGLAYALVAALATAVNIACQALVIALYQGPHAIVLSVLVGTASGLPIKYSLEKKHVFGFRADSLRHDGRLFMVYTFFGAFTTLVFWGTEYAFHAAFGTDGMRYLGGAMGLLLGYVIRYHLDKRFVFVRPQQPAAGA